MGFKETIKAYRARELAQLAERSRIEEAERERQNALLAEKQAAIRRYPEDLQSKARAYLYQSEFPRLLREIESVVDGYAFYPFIFDEKGEMRFEDIRGFTRRGVSKYLVKGIPNAFGIHLKWHYRDDIYRRIVVESDPNGDIVLHGKNKTKTHLNEWMGNPDMQERMMEKCYQEPYEYEDADYGTHGWPDYGNPSH